jgi:hypothetical protein
MARQRIVINLDAPDGGPTKRARAGGGTTRRWPKILALLTGLVLVVVVIAAAGGFLWWRHYQSTPAYTLTLLADAAQHNDLAEFQKRIDDDEVAKNMIASVSQKVAVRYGFALNDSMQAQMDKVMPSLLPRLKQTIHDEVANEIKQYAASAEPKPFILLVVTLPSLIKVTTEGDIAKATAAVSNRAIAVTMRRDAERWKVTEYKDDVVVQRVVDSVMKELPAIGSIDPNSPLLRKPSRRNRRSR